MTFHLDLRLSPGPEGARELRAWPEVDLTPDFAVAASGEVRVVLGDHVIVACDGQLRASPTHSATSGLTLGEIESRVDWVPEVTPASNLAHQRANHHDAWPWWLPDYVGGFALALGRALGRLRAGAPRAQARFLDEPIALRFTRDSSPAHVRVTIEFDGRPMHSDTVPDTALYAEGHRALDSFHRQLLALNPRLVHHPDVGELASLANRLLEPA